MEAIPKRKNGKKLTELWNDFKGEDWKKTVRFTNGEDIYIGTKDIGTGLFFKRGFKLEEIDDDEYEDVFNGRKGTKEKHLTIDSLKYILTILKGIGISEINIDSLPKNVISIDTPRVQFILTPHWEDDEPKNPSPIDKITEIDEDDAIEDNDEGD